MQLGCKYRERRHGRGRRGAAALSAAAWLWAGAGARAEPAADGAPCALPGLHPIGYVEMNFTYALGRPGNGVIAQRGFDNRHATFMLSNAMLGAEVDGERSHGRLALQVGATPATYYQAEPARPAEAGAGALDASLWRHVQEAFAGWRPAGPAGPAIEAGVFLSQIGLEPLAIRDADHWSRSNLFYERAGGDPAGRPWRHLVDLWAALEPSPWLYLAAHGDVGLEDGQIGRSSWWAAAGYARAQWGEAWTLAVRGDWFAGRAPRTPAGARAPIFWPVGRVASGTLTLAFRAALGLRLMAEFRHDDASGPACFRGTVPDVGGVAQPNARIQDTLTAGLVWGL